MRKAIFIISIFGFGLCLYLFMDNLSLRKELKEMDIAEKKKFSLRLSQEVEVIKKELDEKFAQKIAQFKNIYKNLEIEKKKRQGFAADKKTKN